MGVNIFCRIGFGPTRSLHLARKHLACLPIMEDDDVIEESNSGANLLPLALAVLGLVVGGAGLYFGFSANQRIGAVDASVEAGSSSTVRLEKQIETLNTQISELSALVKEQSDAISRQRSYANVTERAVKELGTNVNENRDQLNKLTAQLVELASRNTKPSQPVAQSSNNVNAESGSDGLSTGIYTIVSGDTFARVSAKTGVSLQALLEANPEADPRRLRIGQQIKIPGN